MKEIHIGMQVIKQEDGSPAQHGVITRIYGCDNEPTYCSVTLDNGSVETMSVNLLTVHGYREEGTDGI